jgi:hypothetical protein
MVENRLLTEPFTLDTASKTCKLQCSPGFWSDWDAANTILGQKCISDNCKTADPEHPTKCLTCWDKTDLVSYIQWSGKGSYLEADIAGITPEKPYGVAPEVEQCTMQCTPGYFITAKVANSVDPLDQICGKCDPICAKCQGTATNCADCYSGYYQINGACQPCHGNCKVCTGSAEKCTACWTNHDITLASTGNPRDWKGDGTNTKWRGIALYMKSDLLTPKDSMTGRDKIGPPFEDPTETGDRCTLRCGMGYYLLFNSGKNGEAWYDQSCEPCSKNCRSCVGRDDNCTSCWAKTDVEDPAFIGKDIYGINDTIKFRN